MAPAAASPLILVELNEVNFEFVEHYAARGQLPAFAQLIGEHGYARTRSEEIYEQIEPWIQWVTVHTGKPYAEHRVFRLGDGPRAGLVQVWEQLERRGLRVGAFSPMNAGNALAQAAFFVPDPWTRTGVEAPPLMRAAYQAICQAVGDNAEGRITPRSALQLAAGLLSYSRPRNWPRYLAEASKGLRNHWPRAVFLDRLLADCFIRLWRRTTPDFASVFFNGAAHIQHHYLFNSAAYRGPHRNPPWYLPANVDPVLEIYRLYDRVLADCLALEPRPRLMLATGLHQDPVDEPVFYWRLRDHAGFLRRLGCGFTGVEALMSRDFLIACADREQAAATAARLASGRAPDGLALFEVDNRGETLFVTLTYPRELKPGQLAIFGGVTLDDFAQQVVFVAIKNGHHNGIGYFLDSGARSTPADEPIPLADLCRRVVQAF
ncbi:MAG: hypothetical protein WAO95_14370 [Burkholderiales bacterium]